MNIISDIAGQFKTFLALLKKMPDEEVISVGDMIDRGPDSKSVLEWFMKNGRAILANHEHMMIDYITGKRFYDKDIWFSNGGYKTVASFTDKDNVCDIPKDVIDWLQQLPMYISTPDLLITHAPKHPMMTLNQCMEAADEWEHLDDSIIWNRGEPERIKDKYQIFGHNSPVGLHTYSDDGGDFATCIDDSDKKRLTGIHWPSRKIYQQEYVS